MTENKIAGMSDCVDLLSTKRDISKKEADSILKDVLEVIKEKCIEGGVSFKDYFTIKKSLLKKRKGVCSFNGVAWETKEKFKLKISTGKELSKELNK